MRTLLFVFLSATSLSAAITAEVPVSQPIYGAAPGEQSTGIIAANGATLLAAWSDDREGRANFYAARLTASGELLDPTGIRIASDPAAFNQRLVSVLRDDDGFAVLWNEQISSTPGVQTANRLSAVRIDRDGRVIDGPRTILDNAFVARGGAATNGSTIAVAYNDRYALLDEKLNVVASNLPLPVSGSNGNGAFVASNGSGFMLSWTSFNPPVVESDVAAIDASGHILGVQRFGAVYPAGLASNGSDYLLAYSDPVTRQVVSRRITSKVEAFDAPQGVPAPAGIVTGTDLQWIGNAYLMAFSTTLTAAQQVYGTRIDSTGKPIDAEAFPLSDLSVGNRTLAPSIAWSGTSLGVLWHAGPGDIDTFANIVSIPTLQRSNAILLSRSANQQLSPSLAFSGHNYLATWTEQSGLYAGRLSLTGGAIDGRGIQLASNGNARVVFDGVTYLVAYVSQSGELWTLWTTRVSPDTGEVQAAVPIASQQCSFNFDVSNSLIAWDECRYQAIRVTRLDNAGRPMDLPVAITPSTIRTAAPSIAWNGSEYLIAFQEQIGMPSPLLGCPGCEIFRSNVRAVRLSPQLTVRDTDPLVLATSDTDNQGLPRAASNGSDFLVGWSNMTTGVMFARHVPLDNAITLGNGLLSSLVWDGLHYAAAFTLNSDALLTHTGIDRWLISATPDEEGSPALAVTGTGTVTAAYRRVATGPLYGGVSRVFARDPVRQRSRAVQR
jgi:hypothetical protein